jgi:hypothetical protein
VSEIAPRARSEANSFATIIWAAGTGAAPLRSEFLRTGRHCSRI